MFRVKKLCACLVFCVTFASIYSLLPGELEAHSDGRSVEENVGGYFIDIGIEPEVVVAGELVTFDFSVSEIASGDEAPFDSVRVSIKKHEDDYFIGSVHRPNYGITNFLYAFPEAGEYTIKASFEADFEKIVELSFPLEVVRQEGEEENSNNYPWGAYTVGIVFVLVTLSAMIYFRRKRGPVE